jgi:hypothetical protein
LATGCSDSSAIRSADADALAARLVHGTDLERSEAAQGLAMLGPAARSARGALLNALSDPLTDVRKHAALALAGTAEADARVVAALLTLQDDVVPEVSQIATTALDLIDPPPHLAERRYLPPTYEVDVVDVTRPALYEWRRVDCVPARAESDDENGGCWTLHYEPGGMELSVVRNETSPGRWVWQGAGEAGDLLLLGSGRGDGAFTWYETIAEAQAEAEASGRLLLLSSTKPGCGLCKKFRNEMVPAVGARATRVAVGYVVDAMTPADPAVWNTLHANLPDADLMPLVGVFTPDLQFLTGFSGPPDEVKLLTALANARRMYPASEADAMSLVDEVLDRILAADTEREPAPPEEGIDPRVGQVWCYRHAPADAEAAAPGGASAGPSGWSWRRELTCETTEVVVVPPAGIEGLRVEVSCEPAEIALESAEAVTIIATVANTTDASLDVGTAVLEIPEGLVARSQTVVSLGAIDARDAREVRYEVLPETAGTYELRVRTAGGVATARLVVLPCGLALELEGPPVLGAGVPGSILVRVANTGSLEEEGAVLRVTRSGTAGEGYVDMNVGPLAPGETWEHDLSVRSEALGPGVISATWITGHDCGVARDAAFVVVEELVIERLSAELTYPGGGRDAAPPIAPGSKATLAIHVDPRADVEAARVILRVAALPQLLFVGFSEDGQEGLTTTEMEDVLLVGPLPLDAMTDLTLSYVVAKQAATGTYSIEVQAVDPETGAVLAGARAELTVR